MANLLIRNSRTGYVSFVVKGRNKDKNSSDYGKVQTFSTITGIRAMSKSEYQTFKDWVMEGSPDMRVDKVMNHPYVKEHQKNIVNRKVEKEQLKTTVKRKPTVKKVFKTVISEETKKIDKALKERKVKSEKHKKYLYELKHKYDDIGVHFIGIHTLSYKKNKINTLILNAKGYISESHKRIRHINKKTMLSFSDKERKDITQLHYDNIDICNKAIEVLQTQKANLRR